MRMHLLSWRRGRMPLPSEDLVAEVGRDTIET
jgi:hypothetical protein